MPRRLHLELVLYTLVALGAAAAMPGKKKSSDDFTQTIFSPKELPQVAAGETRRLIFHVSPLTGKGLLAQQTRDALHALLRLNGGMPVIHLRAFVAGSGDVRRVPQIVSEVMSEKKLPLPSVSVVRAGALPLENAQILFEAVSLARREVSAAGLHFAAVAPVTTADPLAPVKPLLDAALDRLSKKLPGETAVAVTCYVSTLADAPALSAAVSERFPGAAASLVQPQRALYDARAACEAAARGGPDNAPKLAFTGTRVAFGSEEKDALLAFQRLDRDLTSASAGPEHTLFTHLYPLSFALGEMSRRLCPPSGEVEVIAVEGLASIDAGFAVDAIAAVAP